MGVDRIAVIAVALWSLTGCVSKKEFLQQKNEIDSLKLEIMRINDKLDQLNQRFVENNPTPKNGICIEEMPPGILKPIIYFYPTDTIDLSVKLTFTNSSRFTFTYPEYPRTGWKVKAFPDGKLIEQSTKRAFYSLFWEGTSSIKPDDATGFVVHRDSLNSFFERSLDALGLNYKEAQEFIVFWSPILQENEYTFIHFSRTNYAQSVKLEITPKPESINRFFMIYRKAEGNETAVPQALTNPDRKGFTVVEWGGGLMNDRGIVHKIQ